MTQKYSATSTNENSAKAYGVALPISRKQSVEICRMLRQKKLQVAKKMLQEVINFERAVPYKRYTMDIPHRKGIAAGKYPINASKNILQLLESVEANAQVNGLNTNLLVISHINAHGAAKQRRFGRVRGSKKRTHIEVIVEERKEQKKEEKKLRRND
ncbi:MAG: 50S ribosomal protein L22 [Candidatus Woesearchaeota archaeon]